MLQVYYFSNESFSDGVMICCTRDYNQSLDWGASMDWDTQVAWAENDYQACWWNKMHNYEQCAQGKYSVLDCHDNYF